MGGDAENRALFFGLVVEALMRYHGFDRVRAYREIMWHGGKAGVWALGLPAVDVAALIAKM